MANFATARTRGRMPITTGGALGTLGKCILEIDPKPFCCRRPGMRCATERLIQIAQAIRAERAVEMLLTAAARLCLRGERPVSQLVNRAARAIHYARELEEWLDSGAGERAE